MRPVDRVDDGARPPPGGDERDAIDLVLHGADDEGRALKIGFLPLPRVEGDGAGHDLARHGAQLLAGLRRVDVDVRPGGGQQLHLPGRAAVGAGQHRPLAVQGHEDGQDGERLEAGGAGASGGFEAGGAGFAGLAGATHRLIQSRISLLPSAGEGGPRQRVGPGRSPARGERHLRKGRPPLPPAPQAPSPAEGGGKVLA